MSNTAVEFYTTRSYLEKNPLWHTEESCWKAEHLLRMINRHKIVPRTICEVGCGAGEVLKQLQHRLDKECYFLGCDISPQAIELCRSRANERLHFELGDVTKISERFFDVILVLDVIEHLEDYFHFCEPSRSEPSTRSSRSRWTSLCKRFYALPR